MNINIEIIRMEFSFPEAVQAIEEFRSNRMKAFETITTELKQALGGAINSLFQTEMTLFLWEGDQLALKTTNPIERVNREFKRRTKSTDSLGERTLQVLVGRDRQSFEIAEDHT